MFNRIQFLMDKGFNNRYEIVCEVKVSNPLQKSLIKTVLQDFKALGKAVGHSCSMKEVSKNKFIIRLNNVPQPAYKEVYHIIDATNEMLLDNPKNKLKVVFEQNV